jgi:hypothetical protein
MRRLALLVLVVGALVLAGCSSNDGGDGFDSLPYKALRAAKRVSHGSGECPPLTDAR